MRPHVLVARLDSMGDVLLAGPAVRAVARGAGRVTMLCGRRGRDAAALLPGVDATIEFTAPWIDPEPAPVDSRDIDRLVGTVAALGVDQAVILTSFHQDALPLALLLRMANVPAIAAVSEDYPGSLLDVRHRAPEGTHEVERNLSLVATLGYRLHPGERRLRLRPEALAGPNRAGDEPYVVVHPGASVPARAWEPERWADLVDALGSRSAAQGDGAAGPGATPGPVAGRKVVVTGSPAERSLGALVAGPPRPGVVNLAGSTDLTALAVVLAGADVAVVANTGPAHLAAAVGTPVVSIFAPTVSARSWRPWGVPHVLLGHHDIACAGCRARTCPIAGHPCVAGISTGDVLAAVDSLAPADRRAPIRAGVA